MSAIALYREYAGCGDDTESSLKHGVKVVLTFWNSETFDAPSHYITEATVVIDHEFTVHEFVLSTDTKGHASHIRKAIARFDQLLASSPEVKTQYEET